MLIETMGGLGDTIYTRPFIRRMALQRPVWLDTKYPDLFSDLPIREGLPSGSVFRPRYTGKQLQFNNIFGALGAAFPPGEFVFDLPDFGPPPISGSYAVIRPPTLRTDFYAPARNPDPAYIARAAEILDMPTVGVANVREGIEMLDGDPPPVDHAFLRGELSVRELMSLVAGASLVVGGPGWQVPAAMAYRTPLLIIYGGAWFVNKPSQLSDPRIDTPVAWIETDEKCSRCGMTHNCVKTISDFDRKFRETLEWTFKSWR